MKSSYKFFLCALIVCRLERELMSATDQNDNFIKDGSNSKLEAENHLNNISSSSSSPSSYGQQVSSTVLDQKSFLPVVVNSRSSGGVGIETIFVPLSNKNGGSTALNTPQKHLNQPPSMSVAYSNLFELHQAQPSPRSNQVAISNQNRSLGNSIKDDASLTQLVSTNFIRATSALDGGSTNAKQQQQQREARKLNFWRNLWNKPKMSPLFLVNGTVCRFINTTPICTTLQTTGLLPINGQQQPNTSPQTNNNPVTNAPVVRSTALRNGSEKSLLLSPTSLSSSQPAEEADKLLTKAVDNLMSTRPPRLLSAPPASLSGSPLALSGHSTIANMSTTAHNNNNNNGTGTAADSKLDQDTSPLLSLFSHSNQTTTTKALNVVPSTHLSTNNMVQYNIMGRSSNINLGKPYSSLFPMKLTRSRLESVVDRY